MSHSSPSVSPRRRPGRSPRPSRGRNRPSMPRHYAGEDCATAPLEMPRSLGRDVSTELKANAGFAMLSGFFVRAIRFALVVTAVCGSIATGAYFAFRNDVLAELRARAAIQSTPSPIETPSAPIVALAQVESAKQVEQAIVGDKKARPNRKHKLANATRKRTQQAPTIAAGQNAYAAPTGQRNY
jgi:hypothetical protein